MTELVVGLFLFDRVLPANREISFSSQITALCAGVRYS